MFCATCPFQSVVTHSFIHPCSPFTRATLLVGMVQTVYCCGRSCVHPVTSEPTLNFLQILEYPAYVIIQVRQKTFCLEEIIYILGTEVNQMKIDSDYCSFMEILMRNDCEWLSIKLMSGWSDQTELLSGNNIALWFILIWTNSCLKYRSWNLVCIFCALLGYLLNICMYFCWLDEMLGWWNL